MSVKPDPFLYAIMDPDGAAHFSDSCVAEDRHCLEETCAEMNADQPDDSHYSVTALYTEAYVKQLKDENEQLHTMVNGLSEQCDDLEHRSDHNAEIWREEQETNSELEALLRDVLPFLKERHVINEGGKTLDSREMAARIKTYLPGTDCER